VGFMCHLAIEKGLKAVIAKDGAIPPKIHTLARIAELAGLADSLTDEQKMLLAELQPLNIEARYPSNKDEVVKLLNGKYCKELITRTEEFLQWIKLQL